MCFEHNVFHTVERCTDTIQFNGSNRLKFLSIPLRIISLCFVLWCARNCSLEKKLQQHEFQMNLLWFADIIEMLSAAQINIEHIFWMLINYPEGFNAPEIDRERENSFNKMWLLHTFRMYFIYKLANNILLRRLSTNNEEKKPLEKISVF